MSSSTSDTKFLVDENVRIELYKHLKENSFDAKIVPKSMSDTDIAKISKSENRILITNDSDFGDSVLFPKQDFFCVLLLDIPQEKLDLLIKAFSDCLSKLESKTINGKVFELRESGLYFKR